MEDEMEYSVMRPASKPAGLRNAVFVVVCLAAVAWGFATFLAPAKLPRPQRYDPRAFKNDDFTSAVRKVDEVFEKSWADAGLRPTPRAPDLAIARRLSLGLMGTVP